MATRRGFPVLRMFGLLGLLAGVGAAQGGRLFDVPAYPVQLDPRQILIADLDGDGGLDQLVPNRASNTVTVRRATGGGLYAPPEHVPVGTSPVALALGRFGGDLAVDVAVLCEGSRDVHVLLSQSDGSFAAGPVLIPPGTKIVSAIGAGDLNGDGHSDIVLTAHQPDTAIFDPSDIVVWFGLAGGGFSEPLLGSVPGRAAAVAVADLDNDGRDEVAVVRSTIQSGVSLVKLAAPGVLVTTNLPLLTFPTRHGIKAADLTLDGQMDLLVVERDANRLVLLAGPSFIPLPPIPAGHRPVDVVIGDLNGDAWPDLVAPLQDSEDVSVLLGTGPGAFGPPVSWYMGCSANRVAIADIHGGGNADVLALRKGSAAEVGRVLAWPGTGDGDFPIPFISFKLPGNFPGTARLSAVGDLSADGFTDVLMTDPGYWWCLDTGLCFEKSDELFVLAGSPASDFKLQTKLNSGALRPILVDVTGDGLSDLVGSDSKGAHVYPGLPGGGLGGVIGIGPFGGHGLSWGDLDGDGDIDVGAAATTQDAGVLFHSTIYRNLGSGLTWSTEPTAPVQQPRDPVFGDIDGDGDLDLAVCTGSPLGEDTPVAVFLNDGHGNFGEPVLHWAGPSARGTVLADLDGDGLLDLAVANRNPKTVTIRYGLGGGALSDLEIHQLAEWPFMLSAVDLDGDRRLDLIASSTSGTSAPSISTLQGLEGGGFGPARDWFVPGSNSGMFLIEDLNKDGRPDAFVKVSSAVVPGVFGSSIVILRNRTGPWTDMGHAFAGALPKAPRLWGQGPLTPASQTRLVLHDAPASAALLLLFGVDAAFAPFKGGVLVPDPVAVVAGLTTDAEGVLIVENRWPAGLPEDFELHVQAWLAAPSPAASNALRARPVH